jgi:hypothetical protein
MIVDPGGGKQFGHVQGERVYDRKLGARGEKEEDREAKPAD